MWVRLPVVEACTHCNNTPHHKGFNPTGVYIIHLSDIFTCTWGGRSDYKLACKEKIKHARKFMLIRISLFQDLRERIRIRWW